MSTTVLRINMERSVLNMLGIYSVYGGLFFYELILFFSSSNDTFSARVECVLLPSSARDKEALTIDMVTISNYLLMHLSTANGIVFSGIATDTYTI